MPQTHHGRPHQEQFGERLQGLLADGYRDVPAAVLQDAQLLLQTRNVAVFQEVHQDLEGAWVTPRGHTGTGQHTLQTEPFLQVPDSLIFEITDPSLLPVTSHLLRV